MKRAVRVAALLALLTFGSFLMQYQSHQNTRWQSVDYSGPLGWLRIVFLDHLLGVTRDARALVAGLSIGDTSLLSTETADSMKIVSLTHLTAVSGANCAIVVGLIFILLRRLAISRFLRWLGAVLVLVFYVVLVGPQPSVLRAAIMAVIIIGCLQLGRKTSASTALWFGSALLAVANPWLLIDYGFQLSVLATFGILQLAPKLSMRLADRLPNWLALSLSVSISAQLLCWPVLLELQPGLSTYSILANILAEPLVAPITVLAMAACAISPVLPVVAGWLTWLASLGAWVIVWIAKNLADLPFATLSWPEGVVGIALASFFVAAAWVRLRTASLKLRSLTSAVLVVAVAFGIGGCAGQILHSADWPTANWSVISCDVGQGDATLIRSQGQIALIDVGRKPGPVSKCLRKLGIHHIDLLVLTHFDLDHVGGLDGAIDGIDVSQALITSYRDSRPAAEITYRKLRHAASRTDLAGKGMTGTIGDFKWQVLSPHMGAAEAEDSNDGSVTILFSSAKLIVLTLADLGEKGQMRLAEESATWLGSGFGNIPVVVKVAHHGSADQYPELYEALRPEVALFSVGAHNDYGHPTKRTLDFVAHTGAQEFRTDQQGSIAVEVTSEGLQVTTSGRG